MDIGCGEGTLLWFLRHYRSPSALGGLEVNTDLVDHAKQLLPEFAGSIREFDGLNFPAELADYDFVILNDVLHHIDPPVKSIFLERLQASMRPSATLILKDIDAGRKWLVWGNRAHDWMLNGAPGSELSISQTDSLLTDAGFRIVDADSIRMLWYPHFTLVARA